MQSWCTLIWRENHISSEVTEDFMGHWPGKNCSVGRKVSEEWMKEEKRHFLMWSTGTNEGPPTPPPSPSPQLLPTPLPLPTFPSPPPSPSSPSPPPSSSPPPLTPSSPSPLHLVCHYYHQLKEGSEGHKIQLQLNIKSSLQLVFIILEKCKGGWGSFSIQKYILQILGTLKRAFWAWNR